MKTKWTRVFIFALLVLALAGCGSKAPAATPAPAGGVESAPTDAPTDAAAPAPAENQAPEDVPLMDGAYDVSIQHNSTQIKYKVDADVQTVVDFYHEVLPPLGWEIKGPPDSVVGSIASMLRKNANNDQLAINMQYNPNAQFTVVTISISRK